MCCYLCVFLFLFFSQKVLILLTPKIQYTPKPKPFFQEKTFQLYCDGVSGMSAFAIDVTESSTVDGIYEQIGAVTEHPMENATLTMGTTILQKGKSLSDYGIGHSVSVKIKETS